MRFGVHGSAIRAVLDLDAESQFRTFVEKDPARLVIDMPILSGKPIVKRSELPALIKDIRLEPLGTAYSRVTMMLDDPAIIRGAFLMQKSGSMPARLVIDMTPASAATFAKAAGRSFGTLEMPGDPRDLPFAGVGGTKLDAISKPVAPSVARVARPKEPTERPLIVIDAGHGGVDPGASGAGVREKDVTLAVARSLRSELESTGRYRVQLTRDRDTFIRLPDRVKVAQQAGADLFISIHADSIAGDGRLAQGASFYTLSDKASDEQTARLAARENQADLLAGIELPTQDREVTTILIDLAMRETTNQSKRFAGQLVSSFAKEGIGTLDAPHRHAGFLVLKAPDVPSVLVELGFLSNPEEVQKLADNTYRTALGRAIAAGVDKWFEAQKP